jgi:glycosyltransferase involved in cell wall biosynthesis
MRAALGLPSMVAMVADAFCTCWMAYVCVWSLFYSLMDYLRLKMRLRAKRPICAYVPIDKCHDKYHISIIIPVRNDAKYIGRVIRNLEVTTVHKQLVDIVIVDGNSSDNSVAVAKASTGVIKVTIVKPEKDSVVGRGALFNIGAKHCDKSDLVFFLRPDSMVARGYDELLRRTLADPTVSLTAFQFQIDQNQADLRCPSSAIWLLERLINFRSKYFLLPHGSQGFAMRLSDFRNFLFSDIIILEDLEFMKRLRHRVAESGQVVRILKLPLQSNPQPWIGLGVLCGTIITQLAHLSYIILNISPDFIYTWYFLYLASIIRYVKNDKRDAKYFKEFVGLCGD